METENNIIAIRKRNITDAYNAFVTFMGHITKRIERGGHKR